LQFSTEVPIVEEMKKGVILFYGFWVPDIFTGVKEAVGIGGSSQPDN
jgi:hypothetical protein